MIKSIFYTRFHPSKGSRVLHQVPEGSITPSKSPSAQREPLFNFPSIADFIIPRQEFCDRLLTVCANHCRIIGYPICIEEYDGKYRRNQFRFNFAMVLDEDAEWDAYASVVRKLARLLKNLEEQSEFLSKEEEGLWTDSSDEEDYGEDDSEDDQLGNGGIAYPQRELRVAGLKKRKGKGRRRFGDDFVMLDQNGHDISPEEAGALGGSRAASEDTNDGEDTAPPGIGSKVYALCEMILEDLNNYCECMIPIDDANTINLKLFPMHPPPAPVHAWHVPLLTIDLASFIPSHDPDGYPSLSSDLTLTRILPYITGTRSVGDISRIADTDPALTRKAIQHLIYYNCVILLDIFQFGAIYAPTAEIGHFVTDEAMQEECVRYVSIPRSSNILRRPMTRSSDGKRSSISIGGSTIASPNLHSDTLLTPHSRDGVAISGLCVPNIAKETLVQLYTSLRQGQTVRTWLLENVETLAGIDVRRMITFGVIKGFLYRVHKYPITTAVGRLSNNTSRTTLAENREWVPPEQSKLRRSWSDDEDEDREEEGGEAGRGRDLPLTKYLDGTHCYDEICTELGLGEKNLTKKLKSFGDVPIIHR